MNDQKLYQVLTYELIRSLSDCITASAGLIDVVERQQNKNSKNTRNAITLLKQVSRRQRNLLIALDCIKSSMSKPPNLQNLPPESILKKIILPKEARVKINRTYRCPNILVDKTKLGDVLMLIGLVFDIDDIQIYTKANFLYIKLNGVKNTTNDDLSQTRLILKVAEFIAKQTAIKIKFSEQNVLLRADKAKQLDLSLEEEVIVK